MVIEFVKSRMLCKNCQRTFQQGDKMRVTTIGNVDKVGGLGIYKDQLTLRYQHEEYEHVDTCPGVQPTPATTAVQRTAEGIPQDWIKTYVDQLIAVAQGLQQGPFRDAVLLRADAAMDLVKSFREARAR